MDVHIQCRSEFTAVADVMTRVRILHDEGGGISRLHLATGQAVWDVLSAVEPGSVDHVTVRSAYPPNLDAMTIFMEAALNLGAMWPVMPQPVQASLKAYSDGDRPRIFSCATRNSEGDSSVALFVEDWLTANDQMIGTAPAFLKEAFTTLWDETAAALATASNATDVCSACAQFHNAIMVMVPFMDGNARFARGVMNWVLTICGMQPLMRSELYTMALCKDAAKVVYRDPLPPRVPITEMLDLIQQTQRVRKLCWMCGLKSASDCCCTCRQFATCGDCDISPHATTCTPSRVVLLSTTRK